VHYEVYIDSVFFLNTCLNLLSLQILHKILKCSATHGKILLGAAGGAFCQCILLIIEIGPIWLRFLLGSLLIDMIMVSVGLRIGKIYYVMIDTAAFMGINVILSGAATFIQNEIENAISHRSHIWELIVIFYMSGWALMETLGKIRKDKTLQLYRVILKGKNRYVEVQALLDTGNGLQDPIFGRPVSIIEEGLVEDWKPFEKQPGFCMIPYHSLGRKNGIMPGFFIENAHIYGKVEERKADRIMIGIYQGKISSDDQYQMILHPKLLQN